jgi:hypothetical protein
MKVKSFIYLDMRRYWMIRHATYDQIESNLTTIFGGKEYLQTHTLSPYFHEIGKENEYFNFEEFFIWNIDFECILRLDNRQPVRCDQYDSMKNVIKNKKLDIPEGCERVAIQLTTPNHYCHNTTRLVGSMEVSFRHLKKLGYRLVIVRIDDFIFLF